MLEISVQKTVGTFRLDASWSAPEPVVALFGASGAGKSLTLHCIAGLVTPDAGRLQRDDVVLFDHRLGIDLRPQARQIGFVFQGYALFPHLTVEENLRFGLVGWTSAARRRRVAELLETLELGPVAGLKPAQLSGGQQQRVALGRAIAPDPALLLLDEPFSALDQPLRRQVREDLGRLIRRNGQPTVLVSHDLADAFQLADRIVVYDRGRVMQSALRDEIFAAPGSEQVARLLGFRNVSQGSVVAIDEEIVTIDWAGCPLRAAAPGIPLPGVSIGSKVTFFVRPEHIRLVRKDRPPPAHPVPNLFTGSIVDRLDLGPSYAIRFAVDLPGGPVVVEIDVARPVYRLLGLAEDQAWEVDIRPSAVQLVPPLRPLESDGASGSSAADR